MLIGNLEGINRSGRQARASSANAVDRHVGMRIRIGRKLCGITLDDLAKTLNVSYQQVQKYELGRNRISAGRLFALTSILGVPITFFFEGIPDRIFPKFDKSARHSVTLMEQIASKETSGLIRAYHGIRDVTIRRKLLMIVRTLANFDQT